MAIFVVGVIVICDKIVARQNLAHEIGMRGPHTGIDYRHDLAGRTGGGVPRGWCLDFGKVPLRALKEIWIIADAQGLRDEVRFDIFDVGVALELAFQQRGRGLWRTNHTGIDSTNFPALGSTARIQFALEIGISHRWLQFDDEPDFTGINLLGKGVGTQRGKRGRQQEGQTAER